MVPSLFFLAPRNPSAHRALQFILTMPGALRLARPCLGLAHRYSHMIDSMGLAVSRVRLPHTAATAWVSPSVPNRPPPAPAISLPLTYQLGGMDLLLIPLPPQPSTEQTASPYWMSNLCLACFLRPSIPLPQPNLGDFATARPV
jgi:hypothetical protein